MNRNSSFDSIDELTEGEREGDNFNTRKYLIEDSGRFNRSGDKQRDTSSLEKSDQLGTNRSRNMYFDDIKRGAATSALEDLNSFQDSL